MLNSIRIVPGAGKDSNLEQFEGVIADGAGQRMPTGTEFHMCRAAANLYLAAGVSLYSILGGTELLPQHPRESEARSSPGW